jgi:EmrB/QacA subfamily drug resistance transporter
VATSSGIDEDTTGGTGRPANRGAILAVACAAQFMVVLDVAIVNVALPSIQRDLGLARDALQWVIIAYGLMLGGFLLLGGRAADLLGRRRVLLGGLVLFTLASLLAGVSESAGFLIGARALQGFGAALLPPAALSILAVTFTEAGERNSAIGLYGAVTGVSASVGVIVSGVLTDGLGWHWIFLVNVPIGAVLIAAAAAFLPRDEGHRDGVPFDAAGAVSVTAGLLLLVYALDRGADVGWGAASTLGPLAGAVVLLAAFAGIERRSRSPLVPGSVVRDRVLVAANLSAFFTFGAFFAFIFLGSLLMQQVLGYSPTRTGLAWLATTATSFVAAAVTGGKLVALVGVRRLLVGGQLLLAVSVALLTRVSPGAGFATDLLPSLLLAGVAGGVAAPAAQIGALSEVTAAMTGLASGLVETMREIGGAVGVAAVAAILVSRAGVDAFHAGFWTISVIAVLGAVAAAIGFPSGGTREVEPVPGSP